MLQIQTPCPTCNYCPTCGRKNGQLSSQNIFGYGFQQNNIMPTTTTATVNAQAIQAQQSNNPIFS